MLLCLSNLLDVSLNSDILIKKEFMCKKLTNFDIVTASLANFIIWIRYVTTFRIILKNIPH